MHEIQCCIIAIHLFMCEWMVKSPLFGLVSNWALRPASPDCSTLPICLHAVVFLNLYTALPTLAVEIIEVLMLPGVRGLWRSRDIEKSWSSIYETGVKNISLVSSLLAEPTVFYLGFIFLEEYEFGKCMKKLWPYRPQCLGGLEAWPLRKILKFEPSEWLIWCILRKKMKS